MPFLRLQEAIELAYKSRAEREKEEWRRAAFVGYQQYTMTPLKKGTQRRSFEEWLDMFGLGEKTPPKEMTVRDEISLVKRLKRMAKRMVGANE